MASHVLVVPPVTAEHVLLNTSLVLLINRLHLVQELTDRPASVITVADVVVTDVALTVVDVPSFPLTSVDTPPTVLSVPLPIFTLINRLSRPIETIL